MYEYNLPITAHSTQRHMHLITRKCTAAKRPLTLQAVEVRLSILVVITSNNKYKKYTRILFVVAAEETRTFFTEFVGSEKLQTNKKKHHSTRCCYGWMGDSTTLT